MCEMVAHLEGLALSDAVFGRKLFALPSFKQKALRVTSTPSSRFGGDSACPLGCGECGKCT